MNIAGGLSALKAAADLTRSIRDAAKAGLLASDEFAGRVAEVYDYIADSKEALLNAQEEISNLQAEVRELNVKLAQTVDADPCPRCRRKGWHVESSEPDATFGDLGGVRRVYRCEYCSLSESQTGYAAELTSSAGASGYCRPWWPRIPGEGPCVSGRRVPCAQPSGEIGACHGRILL
jgi:hypothetical protein